MNIKVIGSGCENCDKTNAIVAECVEELGIDAKIERVADLVEIVKLGVMTAPSVMIDGKLVISGQVPSKKQMMKVLTKQENLIKLQMAVNYTMVIAGHMNLYSTQFEKAEVSWYHKFMLMLCGRTGYTWYNTLFTVRMVSGVFESNLVAREVENSDGKIKHSGWYI